MVGQHKRPWNDSCADLRSPGLGPASDLLSCPDKIQTPVCCAFFSPKLLSLPQAGRTSVRGVDTSLGYVQSDNRGCSVRTGHIESRGRSSASSCLRRGHGGGRTCMSSMFFLCFLRHDSSPLGLCLFVFFFFFFRLSEPVGLQRGDRHQIPKNRSHPAVVSPCGRPCTSLCDEFHAELLPAWQMAWTWSPCSSSSARENQDVQGASPGRRKVRS